MSRTKFFNNPFDDYSTQSAHNLIENGKINANSKVITSVENRWESVIGILSCQENGDYSVYTGTSGIALLKLLKNPEDPSNLQEIKQLLSLDRLKHRRGTFLCGDAGPLAIGAVVTHRLGEHNDTKQLVNRLLLLIPKNGNSQSDFPNEYLYGRAGILFALLFVNKHVTPAPIQIEIIRKVIEDILFCGQCLSKSRKFKFPLMYEWHDSLYLGAAHGVSGILYLLLQAKEFLTEDELSLLIKPTIDYLATLRFPSGNYPSSFNSDNDKYVQWCHGAPGFVFLFSTAYKVFKDTKYLKLALESADVVWNRGLVRKGYSICHGVSGNAYCFLELYQTTQDEKHLYRAIKFAEWCVDYTRSHEEHSPDRPLSLYEGVAGPMYLLIDIQKPMEAKFPGFTL